MNIAYGKIGKSINFIKTKWNVTGGDIEAPSLLLRMALAKPNDTFYILSGNDFSKWNQREKFPNIISLTDGFNYTYDDYTYVYEKIERMGIKFDFGLMYNGITGQNNIPDGDFLKQDGTIGPVKCLGFAERYVAPIFHVLNKTQMKWVLLVTDSRYFPMQSVDCWNKPDAVLGQFNSSERWRTRERMTRVENISYIEQTYSGLENVCLMSWKKMPESLLGKPRDRKITIVLNDAAYGGAVSRGPMLKEYVLDQFTEDTIDVYGKWSDEWMVDERFKGGKKIDELRPLLTDTRYTLCIPIKPDFVTSKFVEMCHFGIIPFLHHTYDTQKHLNVPEILRCKDAADFKRKVEFLESKPEHREKLQRDLWNLYPEKGYYDGTIFINKVYETFKELENAPKRK